MNKKHGKLAKIFPLVSMMLVSAAFGYLAAKYGLSGSGKISTSTAIMLLFLFVPIFFFVIAVHEMGHAIAGLWVNFDFRMYVVGPFMWNKESGNWKFSWNKNVNTAGGLVLCLPTTTENLEKRFCVFALGGPTASLLLAGLCFLIARILPYEMSSATIAEQTLKSSLYIISLLSFVIFIFTALPMHTGGFSTDGARALRLLKGGDASRFEVLLLKTITLSSSGMRPRLLNIDELNEAQFLANKIDAPYGVYLHSYFHQAAWDKGETAEAEKHLLNYVEDAEKIPAGIRNSVWLDAAFFYAFAEKNLPEAEKYWSQFKPTAMIPKAQVLATEAAMAFGKGDYSLAQAKAMMAQQELPNMLDKGLAMALGEKLISLQQTHE